MKKPSIMKRKSNINGQTVVDLKELPKRDPKVSFADSVNNLQLKLFSNEINIKSKNNTINSPSSQEGPTSDYNIRKAYSTSIKWNNSNNGLNNEENIKNNFTKSYSNANISNRGDQENDNMKNFRKRRSMRLGQRKNMDENARKNQGELSTIKEIVIGDHNEKVISNNPKKRFKFEDEEKKKSKKKINLIEELRKFDREEQMKMESYIDKIRKKQIELMYKSSKIYKIINHENNDENINNYNINNNKENNGKINQEIKENKNENISNENNNELPNDNNNDFNSIDNKKNDKNNNNEINKNDAKNKNNNNINNKDDFQKIKEKYFSKFLFTTRFPETEYKIKFLDKYFKNNSLAKNLFANYKEEKEEKEENNTNKNNKNMNNINLNNINIYNSNKKTNININSFKTPLVHEQKQKENINKSDSNINTKNNIISPKILYKNSNETDTTNTVIDSNHKYNNLEQSMNSNAYTYTMRTNRIFNKYKNNDEFDNTYKMIINTIDNKLYNNKKYKNEGNFGYDNINKRIISSSTDKIKAFSTIMYKTKNQYDKEIEDKYNRYNESKMTPYFIKNHINNNYNKYSNKDHKFIRALGRMNNNKNIKKRIFNFKLI